MEKDGLVTRSQLKSKTRAVRVSLTDFGLDVLKNNSTSKAIDEILSFLSDEDRQRMYLDLNRTLSELKIPTYKL